MVATVDQHGRTALAVPPSGISQKKDAEKRDKERVRTREGHGPGKAGENLPRALAILKTVSLTCERNAT